MENSHLATNVKEYRIRKGMSQEALAEASGLSHRTIQRIENGASNPTGDTLQRLSAALGLNPDELIDWTIKEDKEYLIFFNLSTLAFIFFPVLGILVPFIMWTAKKRKVKYLDKAGRDLINFEINWVILLIVIPLALFLLKKIELFAMLTYRDIITVVVIMYLLNIVFIIYNTVRVSHKKEVLYYYFIGFLS